MEKKVVARRDLIIAALAVAVLAVGIVLALLLDGRRDGKPLSAHYFDLFNSDLSVITDYSGDGEEKFRERCAAVSEVLNYYNKLFDIYNEYEGMTNAATVNRLAGSEEVRVPRELIDFLVFSKELYVITEGKTNVAMGAVLKLWHDAREHGTLHPADAKIPEMNALTEAAKHCDIEKLVIDEAECTVRFLDPGMSLDLGAVGKGYATEMAARRLEQGGADAIVLEVGGNVRIIGEKPSGKGIKTGIQNPDLMSDDRYVFTLELKDTSAVTSGSYQRFYTASGVKYHHIIDPDTLMPSEGFASVTVIVKDSGLADGLSTALFSMTYEEGVRVLQGVDGARAVWVTPSGELLFYGI